MLGALNLFVRIPWIERYMLNYPGPLDPMQQKEKKKNIFNILGSKGKSLENFTFDFDVPKSILLSKDET